MNDLAAGRGGGLFAAAFPGTVGTVNVVEPSHAGVETEIFAEVSAHPLGKEFLPAVAIFGHRGIGVGFFERHDVF